MDLKNRSGALVAHVLSDHIELRGAGQAAVFAILRQLEGRKTWQGSDTLRMINTRHNLDTLRQLPGLKVLEPTAPVAAPQEKSNYKSLTNLHPHQKAPAEQLRRLRYAGLFMEQGTGKTKLCLDRAGELWSDNKITGLLVVSKKGVHRQWVESEAPKHLGIPFKGYVWPIPKLERRTEELEILSINYEACITPKGKKALAAFTGRHKDRLLIVCDESQSIKNKRSKRWAALKAIAPNASHRIIATGTPIAKDLTDEWSQLHWLDESIVGIRFITTFRSEYCVMGGYENRQVIAHKNIARFKELTAPFVCRVTKDEIGILPKQYSRWHFDLTEAQRDALRAMKEELEVELASGHTVSAANVAAKLNKMMQISSGFIHDEAAGVHHIVGLDENPRVQAMLEWLDANDAQEKFIVWVNFRAEARVAAEALAGKGISFVEYHGGVKERDKKEALRNFLSPEGASVFVANPASAGTGLNLQGLCNRALYFTNSFSFIDREQSEDRIHRIGTKGTVIYTDLIANGGLDAYVLKNLRQKKGLSTLVLDGSIKEALGEII